MAKTRRTMAAATPSLLLISLLLLGQSVLGACTTETPERATNPIFDDRPRPADSQAYPNLSTVPPRPQDLPSPEERARIRDDLEQDRLRLHEATGL